MDNESFSPLGRKGTSKAGVWHKSMIGRDDEDVIRKATGIRRPQPTKSLMQNKTVCQKMIIDDARTHFNG